MYQLFLLLLLLFFIPRYGFPRWETKINTRNLLWWSIIRAVFISKALVQQGSVETPYQVIIIIIILPQVV